MLQHYAFQNATRLFLVADYCAGGELYHHLTKQVKGGRFTEPQARLIAAEITLGESSADWVYLLHMAVPIAHHAKRHPVAAFEHLHQHDIAYRDLKPENGWKCRLSFSFALTVSIHMAIPKALSALSHLVAIGNCSDVRP